MNKYYKFYNIYIYIYNYNMTNDKIQDNDWGLFVDIENNTSHNYPDVTMKQLDKYTFDSIKYRKSSSNFEHCFHYIYYYLGIYVIQYMHK
jgi:hypothetical protein